MSRVRYAVRFGKRGRTGYSSRAFAHEYAQRIGGKVVRVTQYDAAETAARRAVIEAARVAARWSFVGLDAAGNEACVNLRASVDALEALERKEEEGRKMKKLTPAQWRVLGDFTKSGSRDPDSGLNRGPDTWFNPKWKRSVEALQRAGYIVAEHYRYGGRGWITAAGRVALERKAATPTVTLTGEQAAEVRFVGDRLGGTTKVTVNGEPMRVVKRTKNMLVVEPKRKRQVGK